MFDSPVAHVALSGNSGQVDGLQPGSGILTVFDRAGRELDRTTISVASVDGVAFANGWGAAEGPTVLAGATERYRVRLLHGDIELIGYGLTQFSYEGALKLGSENEAPFQLLPDTEEAFAVAALPGAGTLRAQSGTATATLPVTAVGEDAITSGIATVLPSASGAGSCMASVHVTARTGEVAVYGPQCKWSTTNGVYIEDDYYNQWADGGGWTGDDPARRYAVSSNQPGTYHLNCELTPSVTVGVDVTLGK
jgi:hypothetical protein